MVYIGFGIGVINTLIFVRKDFLFTPDQYALVGLFTNVAVLFYSLASLGSLTVLYKFYPYYKDNLPDDKNDLFTRTLIINVFGIVIVCFAAIVFRPLVVRKYSEHSKLFVDYYHWIFPFAIGLTIFSLLESYTWVLQKTVISSFLKETALRILTLILIALYYFNFITYQHFVFLFSGVYFVLCIILFVYLKKNGGLHITFSVSRVTKKFRKKMMAMQALVFGGITIINIGQTIDGLIIASLKGLTQTAVYTLATYAANIVQVPQRSIVAISTGVLVREWKEKNYAEISRIYERSCINMLLLALFIFGNIWLNVMDGLKVLKVQNVFSDSMSVMLVIGMIRIMDAGTGVNNIIISTSNKWKFEFYTGIGLLAMRIPLAYIFVKHFGIIGSAYAELITLTIFNYIRFEFLRRTYNMQPFTMKTVYALLLGFGSYFAVNSALGSITGWTGIILRGFLFSGLMVAGTFILKLTPDAMQLYDNFKKRFA